MSSQIETCIGFINESCDTQSAYFSFTTDETGEHGVIKANKEGLRLYAMELLKKSIEMEKSPASEDVLFFDEYDWLVDDAGYNLIWGVVPTGHTRNEIVQQAQGYCATVPATRSKTLFNSYSSWLPPVIILSGGLIIVTLAALKWFQ
ncbi:MAG: hypothetical protein EOO04_12855 [Chitinophagaceae bacterium]|nr:MAG: hypothetical protein EOO04_12855 [Chitinophagaceae bacterium]